MDTQSFIIFSSSQTSFLMLKTRDIKFISFTTSEASCSKITKPRPSKLERIILKDNFIRYFYYNMCDPH